MDFNQSEESADVNIATSIHSTIGTTASSMPKTYSPHIISRHDNIAKSPNDKINYRGLILKNKLKVLLISDPTTEKAAASMDVSVGYFADPDNLPGLAHFCEHMLFLGTEKYPTINDYNSFLSQNGGSANAATFTDRTNYFFDVASEKLEQALDRFAQFFISPLFSESMTERELNAVNSEHMKNKAIDAWRFDMVEKSACDPSHPYSKFSSGDRETLETIPKQNNINVRQALLDFHNKWYSSNLMALCVLGKETLDELEEIVIKLFSDIVNKEAELVYWNEHPFKQHHFMHKWYIVPVKDIRSLSVAFPIPYLWKYYKSSPVHYISHLLGHEGKGSLISALKEKGWCNSLIGGDRMPARGFAIFYVYVDLTEEGINHVDDIVTMIFNYINLLNKEGPLKWIYEEYRDIAEMNFRFKEKTSARNLVQVLVSSLQEYPMEEVLTAPCLFPEWRPDLIKDVLTYLKPENVRLKIVGQKFQDIATETEKWYQTQYKKEAIPQETITKWKESKLDPSLHLPLKNEFVPTKFDIKLNNNETVDKYPVIIENTPLTRVWFKQDAEFLVPKVNCTMDFVSSLASVDPLSGNMTSMFVKLLKDSLNEYSYDADLAGVKWGLVGSKYGIALSIGGYDHKQGVLLEKIMDRMVNFTVDPKRFEIWKEHYIRSLKNFQAEQPYQHASFHLISLLTEQVWSKEDLLEACEDLTVSRLQQFIPQMLSKVHIECLFHGNITKSEALSYVRLVETKLTNSIPDIIPLLSSQLLPKRTIQINSGGYYLYEVENNLHKSSCALIYYQVGTQSTEMNMIVHLFVQIISEPSMTVLRTQEQLGYIVFCGIYKTGGVQGIRVIVQSEFHPEHVEQRIDNFMELMLKNLIDMSEEEFSKHKESLAKHLFDKPKKLTALSAEFWREIIWQEYNFDRVNIEAAYLKTITKDQMINFFKEFMDQRSSQRCKLAIHVISTQEGGAGDNKNIEIPKNSIEIENSETPIKIVDILQFKSNQHLYPLPKPFINVPRKGMQQQSKL